MQQLLCGIIAIDKFHDHLSQVDFSAAIFLYFQNKICSIGGPAV